MIRCVVLKKYTSLCLQWIIISGVFMFSAVSCVHWTPGTRTMYDSTPMSSLNLKPKSVKSFSPQWREVLGDQGPFISPQGFIGGVALHQTRPLLAIVGFDNSLQIRHQKNGQLLWSESMKSPGVGAPLFDGDRLLVPTGDGRLSAYNVQTHKVAWRRQFSGIIRSPLTLDDHHIYVSDGTNSIYALNRKTGQIIWQRKRETPKNFSLQGEARPLVYNGVVYMGFSDGYLVAFNSQSGQPLWERDLAPQRETFQDIDGDPIISHGILYVASAASGIYALNPKTGEQRWFHPIAGVVSMSEFEGELMLGLQHGEFGRFNPYNRRFSWRITFGSEGSPSRPVRFPYGLIISLSRGGIYVLNAQTGELRDQFTPGSGVLAPLALSEEGWLYASSLNGYLYAFSPR